MKDHLHKVGDIVIIDLVAYHKVHPRSPHGLIDKFGPYQIYTITKVYRSNFVEVTPHPDPIEYEHFWIGEYFIPFSEELIKLPQEDKDEVIKLLNI